MSGVSDVGGRVQGTRGRGAGGSQRAHGRGRGFCNPGAVADTRERGVTFRRAAMSRAGLEERCHLVTEEVLSQPF